MNDDVQAREAGDRYAVIGHPIAHSRSPAIHGMFAQQTGQRLRYERRLAPLDGFEASVQAFRAEGGRGLNVTVPFKLEAFRYATDHTARARAAGAVNTLAFDGDRVLGDNTDGAGLVADLQGRLGLSLVGARVLLLGAGGAARGVILPLLEAGVSEIQLANRTAARAQALLQAFGDARLQLALPPLGAGFDVVINATAAGLADASPLADGACLAGAALAYDMVYGARPTAFMMQAREAGCRQASDGLGMLVEQAAESFLLWRGVRPVTASVYAALRAEIDGPSQAR